MLKMQAAYTRLRVGTHDLKLFMQISCSEHVVRSYSEAMSVPKPKNSLHLEIVFLNRLLDSSFCTYYQIPKLKRSFELFYITNQLTPC